MNIGFAMCGSFCTFDAVFHAMEAVAQTHTVIPILSTAAGSIDSRFGTAREHIRKVTALCGMPSVDYAAQTIMHHLDDYGGMRYEVGYSSSIAVVLFVIMYGSNYVIKKALSKVGQ